MNLAKIPHENRQTENKTNKQTPQQTNKQTNKHIVDLSTKIKMCPFVDYRMQNNIEYLAVICFQSDVTVS